jgi:hypothetical protein
LIHGNTDIIHDLTLLLLEVPMASVTFLGASMTLLLEVPTAATTSIVPNPAVRVESTVEVWALLEPCNNFTVRIYNLTIIET